MKIHLKISSLATITPIFLFLSAGIIFTACSPLESEESTANPVACSAYSANGVKHAGFCTGMRFNPRYSGLNFGIQKAVGQTGFLWNKTNLTVAFLDGSKSLQSKVKTYAKEWEQHCAIRFNFVSETHADIRISFSCSGHWSFIGNTAQNVPSGKATMNLHISDSTWSSEIKRITLHEFGHAIGMDHEHRHPNNPISWNEENVIQYYAETQGWSPEQTRVQVINKIPSSNTLSTGFDSKSIMLYPIPKNLTTNGFSSEWNTNISTLDKAWANMAYPTSR